eukprot:m.140898 g.140898  ORF g.140898 m.140898 type:complete len:456 (+) comp30147_c1_seq3:332-1699(+)
MEPVVIKRRFTMPELGIRKSLAETSYQRVGANHHDKEQLLLRQQRFIFGLTYLSYSCIYFARKPFSVIKKNMGDELGLDTATLGMIDTSFLVMYALGQFTLPPYGDKFGARFMLGVCFIVSALCTVGFASTSVPTTFVILWGINGFAQGLNFPLCFNALNSWFHPSSRGMVLGFWTTSQQVGGVLSTAFAGFVAANYGWRPCLYISGYLVAVAGVLLKLFLVNHPKDVGLSVDTSQSPRALTKEPTTEASVSEVLGIPGIKSLGISYLFIKLARYTLMFWLPFYLSKEHGYSTENASYISTMFDIGGILGSLACGYVSDHVLKGNRALAAGPMCVFTGLALLLYPSFADKGVVTNCIFLFIIGFNVAGPDSVLGGASTADACERAKMTHMLTRACGITNGLGSIGSMLQGPISSSVVELYGWNGLFTLLGSLCMIGALCLSSLMINDYKRLRAIT